MRHVVQPGESIWSIADEYLGSGERWREIANDNRIRDPYQLLVGQQLQVGREGEAIAPVCRAGGRQHGPFGTSLIPANSYLFVLADEINPLRAKAVRRVLVSPRMAAEASASLGRPLQVFPNPERFGFQASDPSSRLPPGRHAMGMKPSPYISASERLMGARRFTGSPFWIDIDRATRAGATIHSTSEILSDLDRIAAKAASTSQLSRISDVRAKVVADSEVLLRGNVPASAVKGTTSMALTRGLQGVQIVGFAVSAIEITRAAQESVGTRSVRPIGAEAIRQVGGWGAAWAGMKLGAAGGALVGITTGPGAILTGAAGAIAGGFAGYFGFDWVADHIYEN